MYLRCFWVYSFSRVDLIYHQKRIGGSIIEPYMIFSKSRIAGKAPSDMKLVYKWLKYTMNKFAISSQAIALRKDILHFYLFTLDIFGFLLHNFLVMMLQFLFFFKKKLLMSEYYFFHFLMYIKPKDNIATHYLDFNVNQLAFFLTCIHWGFGVQPNQMG